MILGEFSAPGAFGRERPPWHHLIRKPKKCQSARARRPRERYPLHFGQHTSVRRQYRFADMNRITAGAMAAAFFRPGGML